MRRHALAVALAAGSLAVAASCAVNEDTPREVGDAAPTVIPPDASEAGDASEAAAPAPCTTEWCEVPLDGLASVALNAIWGSGPNDVWVVGTRGYAAHFDGTKWESRSAKTLLALFSIWGSGPTDVWAGNSGKSLFHWQGTEWQESTLPPGENRAVIALGGAGPENVLAVVEPSGEFFTSCDGPSFAFGSCPTVYRLSKVNGTLAWRPATTDAFACKNMFVSGNQCAGLGGLWVGASGEPWLVGQGGKALRPSGAAAPPALSSVVDETHSIGTLEAVSGSSANDVWAVGAAGAIRHFTGGADWAAVDSPTAAHLRAVWTGSATEAWAVGDDGVVVHFDGKRWQISTSPEAAGSRTLYGVWGTAGGDVFAAGEHVLLRRAAGSRSAP